MTGHGKRVFLGLLVFVLTAWSASAQITVAPNVHMSSARAALMQVEIVAAAQGDGGHLQRAESGRVSTP